MRDSSRLDTGIPKNSSGMSRKQAALNKIERMAEELAKELGVPKDAVVEDIKNKLLGKK